MNCVNAIRLLRVGQSSHVIRSAAAGQLTLCNRLYKMDAKHTAVVSEFERELSRLGLSGGGGSTGRVRLDKDVDRGLAVITIDHPDKRNAFNGSMMLDLSQAVDDLERWEEGKGVIVWGGPNIFCSGADLNMVQKLCGSGESGAKMWSMMHQALTRLLNLPLISVALITGKALGGGAEIMTACDFRLMASDAEIQFLQQRMGLTTGWGGGARLVQLIGRTSALDLLSSCRRVSAEEALRLGLADEVLSPSGSASLDEAKRWVVKRTQGEAQVVRAMKTMVSRAADASSHQEALNEELAAIKTVWGGKAQLKAIEKFQQK